MYPKYLVIYILTIHIDLLHENFWNKNSIELRNPVTFVFSIKTVLVGYWILVSSIQLFSIKTVLVEYSRIYWWAGWSGSLVFAYDIGNISSFSDSLFIYLFFCMCLFTCPNTINAEIKKLNFVKFWLIRNCSMYWRVAKALIRLRNLYTDPEKKRNIY